MQNLQNLIAQYTKTVQRTTVAQRAFNSTLAFAVHSVALQALQTAYIANANNTTTKCTCTRAVCKCATQFVMRVKLNNAITRCSAAKAQAFKQNNFVLQKAVALIAAMQNA
jgi:hypothetical protein